MQTTFLFDPSKKIGIERLQCVECKKSLEFVSVKKLKCKNKHEFSVLNNVPILLSKDSRHILQQSLSQQSGEIMTDEYNLSRKAKIKRFIKK